MFEVRRARTGDAAGIAAVHIDSWVSTYSGLLPAAYIAARTFAVRESFWTDRLLEDDPATCIFVACEADGRICGFASGGPELTEPAGLAGELYSIYLSEWVQGTGTGRRLVEAVLGELPSGPVAVWALAENPACGFYERLGGRAVKEKLVDMGGEMFREILYLLPPVRRP